MALVDKVALTSGQQVGSGRVAYASSKGGVLALAKACAIDLSGSNAAEAVDRANPQIRISFEAKDTTGR